jgi:hypothetical protein
VKTAIALLGVKRVEQFVNKMPSVFLSEEGFIALT